MRQRLRAFWPHLAPVPPVERLRAFLGALIGIAVTGLVSHLWHGGGALPLLIAPMGASAVLLFAVPASPLAQPWSILGGNIISALIGVTAARFIPDPTLAAAVGVSAAIAAMSLAGCLHPPGGAVALTAVVGGPVIAAAGYSFVLVPVALNSVLLLLVALAFNNLTRRPYPHFVRPAPVHGPTDPPADQRIGFTPADIDRALERYGELLDVSPDDLDALFREVETQAHRRLHGEIRSGMIMSRDLVTLSASDTPDRARDLLIAHDVRALPVVDEDGRAIGLVTRADLLRTDAARVETLMRRNFPTAHEATAIDDLLQPLSRGGSHLVMVNDAEERLAGVITKTDLLAALYRARVVEAVVGAQP